MESEKIKIRVTSFTFISMLRAEHYKAKNNLSILLVLLCPLVTIMGRYISSVRRSLAGTMPEEMSAINFWISFARDLIPLYVFYPLLVSLLAYSLCDMEYRNHSFRRLFTLPYSFRVIFASKIVFLTEIVFASSLIAYLSFMSSNILPGLPLQDYDARLACFYFHFRLFIGLLAVSFIQLGISLAFRNFFIPIGFACFMTALSTALYMITESVLSPFVSGFQALLDFAHYQSVSLSKYEYASLAVIFVFLFIDFFLFRRQKTAI